MLSNYQRVLVYFQISKTVYDNRVTAVDWEDQSTQLRSEIQRLVGYQRVFMCSYKCGFSSRSMSALQKIFATNASSCISTYPKLCKNRTHDVCEADESEQSWIGIFKNILIMNQTKFLKKSRANGINVNTALINIEKINVKMTKPNSNHFWYHRVFIYSI